jgi:hypothetical protein
MAIADLIVAAGQIGVADRRVANSSRRTEARDGFAGQAEQRIVSVAAVD